MGRFGWLLGPNKSASEGVLTIPRYRIAVCMIPKNGCTTLKWILMRLLGRSADEICGCDEMFGCIAMELNNLDSRYWSGVTSMHQLLHCWHRHESASPETDGMCIHLAENDISAREIFLDPA